MVYFVHKVAELPLAQHIIVIGTKSNLFQQCTSSISWLSSILSHYATEVPTTSLLSSILATLTPQADVGDTTECWLPTTTKDPIRIAFCALPLEISRHNSPAQPHAITKFVKQYKTSAPTTIAIVLEDASHAFAAGCAIARASAQYSRKNGSQNGVPASTTLVPAETVHAIFSHECSDLEWIQHTSNGIQRACRLVDTPPNELHSDAYIAEAKAMAEELQVDCEVIQGNALEEQGFGGLYGVGKAAVHQPALVRLSYFPPGTSSTSPNAVVLVGKGIIFDTGGLSIKGKEHMPGMKRDMGGSAALFGAFEAAVRSKVYAHPLHVVLCLAENAVGPLATRPDDVHVLYSGKTVEINNTDAEGRLVLGDGVAYAVKTLAPATIIDMATLTGAQGIAVGRYFGGLYCNNETLESIAVHAGRSSGDLTHPLPYAPEFFRPEFQSAIADMKNSVKDRSNAQVSCAGQFIGNHLGLFEKEGQWLHIDMAFPSFSASDERATGYGVALIQHILQALN